MGYFLLKAAVSGLVIAGASELGKRYTWLGAILISLPLMSLMSILWLYRDTGDPQKVVSLAHGILLALVPSLLFFVVLPALLKAGWKFAPALGATCAVLM